MYVKRLSMVVTGVAAVLAAGLAAPAVATPAGALTMALARQALPAGDGWGSVGDGTSGGAAADDAHVHTVRTRQQLVEALKPGDGLPRIIILDGTIDASSDAAGKHLDCLDYYPDYSFEAYLSAAKAVYDRFPAPAQTAERKAALAADPTFAALEAARAAAASRELRTIRFHVPANTTIFGRNGATLQGGGLMLDKVSNVILRNFTVRDTVSCFPEYTGDEWVAENFDAISLWTATRVWIDHLTVDGGITEPEPVLLGYQFHVSDGVLDMVRATDLVTVSWNVIKNGDKAMLWGNTNNGAQYGDDKALRITMHHNLVDNLVERQPRVRWGQVHVYNNHFILRPARYNYAWGVGNGSRLWIEDNAVTATGGITPEQLLYDWSSIKPANVHVGATLFNGRIVDALSAYNAARDPDLGSEVGWAPTHYGPRHPVRAVKPLVAVWSGAGRLGR